MFVAQAHSFTEQSRLAITLAWVAGYANIVGVLACGHVISHVSGTTSDIGRHAVDFNLGPLAFALFLVGTFLLGATLSGFTTELGRRRGWESIYVLPMCIEATLLAAFAVALEVADHGAVLQSRSAGEISATIYALTGLASTAMGVQNATITRISSGVVRTTHVTGVLTDLGLELAQNLWARHDAAREREHAHALGAGGLSWPPGKPSGQRLVLLASIVGSFALGAALGTLAFETIPKFAMFPPVAFLVWLVYQDVTRPIAEVEASELVGETAVDLPATMEVFRLKRDGTRRGGVQRMPNLLAWADRLDPRVRVVVLDLGEVTALDRNSVLELRALQSRLARQHRTLVLAGLSPAQFGELNQAAGGELDPHNAAPDLELAIARGLSVAGV